MDEQKFLKYLSRLDTRIGRRYSQLMRDLAACGVTNAALPDGRLFRLAQHPEMERRAAKAVTKFRNTLQQDLAASISEAITMSFNAAPRTLHGLTVWQEAALGKLRDDTAKSWLSSRLAPPRGLSLSDRVWNIAEQGRAEFEMGVSDIITDGLRTGTSASELAMQLQGRLANPDAMYRRYHLKETLADGSRRDRVEWRKRTTDEEGHVRFQSTDIAHPGAGVYRSARQNALRLAATEVNTAYRWADCTRWHREKFVIGIRIRLSGHHGKADMCDIQADDYPQEFTFTGWHPRCRCVATPITMEQKELEHYLELKPVEQERYLSPNRVREMPEGFTRYVNDNRERIAAAVKRGAAPEWVTQNFRDGDPQKGLAWANNAEERARFIKEAAKKRHAARDSRDIQLRWNERRADAAERRMCDIAASLTYSKAVTYDLESEWGKALAGRYYRVCDAIEGRATASEVSRLMRRFADGVATRERWDKQLWDGFSEAQIKNCREFERLLGIKKGRPMTWEQANTGRENPLYVSETRDMLTGKNLWSFQENCQTCTVTHELRRRGFNVTAAGLEEGFVNTGIVTRFDLSSLKMAQNRFISRKGGEVVYFNMGEFIDHNKNVYGKSGINKFIKNAASTDGRYEVTVKKMGQGGHVFCVERRKGKLLWFDPQSGVSGPEVLDYLFESKVTPRAINIARIDDAIINTKMSAAFRDSDTRGLLAPAPGYRPGGKVLFAPPNRIEIFGMPKDREANRALYHELRQDKQYRSVDYDRRSGGVLAVHRKHGHFTSKNLPALIDGKNSDELEWLCAKRLQSEGHVVILLSEIRMLPNGMLGRVLDMSVDGKIMDIRSVVTQNKEIPWKTLRNNLISKNRQATEFMEQSSVTGCDSLCLYFHDPSMFNEEDVRRGKEAFRRTCRRRHIAINIDKVLCVFGNGRHSVVI